MSGARQGAARCAALFLCLTFALPVSAGGCPPIEGAFAKVRKAFDGDTLLLTDGRKVRLAGVDTPEKGHDGTPDEPYARPAQELVRRLLKANRWRIRLAPARESRDKYGRILAYVAGADGSDLQVRLLEAGLALTTILPPNLSRLSCLKAAEHRARQASLGLWRLLPKDPQHLKGAPRHLVVRGRVRHLGHSRRSLWIDLDGPLSLRIARADRKRFRDLDLDSLRGREIEAQGWLHRRKRGWMIRVRHPAALQVLDPIEIKNRNP